MRFAGTIYGERLSKRKRNRQRRARGTSPNTHQAGGEHHLANKAFVVHDGAEALDYFFHRGKFQERAPGNPVFVMLDNKMPKINGLEVLKIIKADEDLKTIPVVVLTSSRATPDLVEFYKHGVNAYVVKPVDFSEFMEAVKKIGIFWAEVNEPPPQTGREETSVASGEAISSGKKEGKNEIATKHPASGG
jgi:CheY-like chemotaxis protein